MPGFHPASHISSAEEIDELKAAVAMWNGAGSGLFVPDIPALAGDKGMGR